MDSTRIDTTTTTTDMGQYSVFEPPPDRLWQILQPRYRRACEGVMTFSSLPAHQTFEPADQPEAIAVDEGIADGLSFQTLLGGGVRQTYTMANVIARLSCPAIIIAPNKTLAAQLYSEMHDSPKTRSSILSLYD
jgi:hypothetical protein